MPWLLFFSVRQVAEPTDQEGQSSAWKCVMGISLCRVMGGVGPAPDEMSHINTEGSFMSQVAGPVLRQAAVW
jgi:hypothetical protein